MCKIFRLIKLVYILKNSTPTHWIKLWKMEIIQEILQNMSKVKSSEIGSKSEWYQTLKLSMVVTFYGQILMWYTFSIWLNINHLQKIRHAIWGLFYNPLIIVLKTYFVWQNIFFSALFFQLVVINFNKDVHWIFFQIVPIVKNCEKLK